MRVILATGASIGTTGAMRRGATAVARLRKQSINKYPRVINSIAIRARARTLLNFRRCSRARRYHVANIASPL